MAADESKKAYADLLRDKILELDDNGWRRWASELLHSEAMLLAQMHWCPDPQGTIFGSPFEEIAKHGS